MRLLTLIQTLLLLLLFFALGFSLSTCAPLPKEGESGYQLTIQLQTRSSERLGRSNSYNLRKSEFAVLVPAGTTFNETGAGARYTSQVSLSNNSVSFTNVSAGNYDLFLYRYDTELSSFPATATAIDYGISQSSLSIPPSTSPVSVTIQLQKEVAIIDSAIQGLNYTAGGRSGTTDADGLLYYFPKDASVTLSLGDILLGTGTGAEISDEAPITPYDLFGVAEGQLADNVTNFARLLLTLDNDSNAENGIQLNSDLSSNLGTIDNISDFNVDNLTAAHGVSLSVSKEEALQHLHESMRRKNLGLDNYSQYPEPGQDSVALDSIVAIAFAEPLRERSVDNQSLLVTLGGTPINGSIHHQANRLWFVPSAGLSANTDYTITLSSNLRGQSGGVPSISGWTFKSGYHRDNGTADAVRQWLLNSSSVSSGSTGASLQH
ncbi:MAG: Ig-like domain-containing protein, partial [bacterium]